MQLGRNEIKQRVVQFSRGCVGSPAEEAEAKSFWDMFLACSAFCDEASPPSRSRSASWAGSLAISTCFGWQAR